MKIIRISIDNYKSLRRVTVSPAPLMVLVGQNAAGKTNFSDALDFLSEVYKHGLEVAVARKGGYENICFRRSRRSKSPIRFSALFELSPDEAFNWYNPTETKASVFMQHTFAFRAESQSILSSFSVCEEEILMGFTPDKWDMRISKLDEDVKIETPRKKENVITEYAGMLKSIVDQPKHSFAKSTALLSETVFRFLPRHRVLQTLAALHVYQLFPPACREAGVPIPNPELGRFGSNLPATIDLLRTHYDSVYEQVLVQMRRIMPSLQDLETPFTHRKTLGLSFRELGINRSWPVEDISDGTVQVLAMLVALYDPRTHGVVVEEPENSVHPWILREVVEACKEVSHAKQVILTTHSPIVINMVAPENLYIAFKWHGETHIDSAINLDDALLELWRGGGITLADYLDSGILREAVPGGGED